MATIDEVKEAAMKLDEALKWWGNAQQQRISAAMEWRKAEESYRVAQKYYNKINSDYRKACEEFYRSRKEGK